MNSNSTNPPTVTVSPEPAENSSSFRQRFTLTCEAISGVIYDLDARRGTVVRSSGLYQLLGYYPDEVPQEPSWWNEQIHPDDRSRVIETFDLSDRHCEIEYRIRHRAGHYVHVSDQALVIRDPQGQIERVVGSNINITRYKQIETILDSSYREERSARQAAERTTRQLFLLQKITHAFSVALTSKDVSHILLQELSAAFRADAGWLWLRVPNAEYLSLLNTFGGKGTPEPSEVLNLKEDLPPCLAIKEAKLVIANRSELSNGVFPNLSSYFRKDCEAGMLAYPLLLGPEPVGVIALGFSKAWSISQEEEQLLRIVTQQCAQAFERARLYESELNARRSAEMASNAKDEFFATVSHELRAPLQSILGWIRLARRSKLDAATSARALEVMERNTRTQVQLVSDMLETSRIITGKFIMTNEPQNLIPIIEGAVDSIRPLADHKHIELQTELASNLPIIWGDANRLQQVFWNLLSNAVKFTPNDGKICVRASMEDNFVTIEVQDTGEGIPVDFIPHLFERLSQGGEASTRIHGGLGLGLAIVKHLVHLHGGRVEAHSEGPNRGSVFQVRLPIGINLIHQFQQSNIQRIDKKAKELSNNLQYNLLSGIRMLIVEDDADAREFFMTVLEGSGAEVCGASSAAEALKAMPNFRPSAVLSDIGLPDTNGYELMKTLRRDFNCSDLPAIALSAFARPEDKARAIEAGFQLYLAKPIDPEELVRGVSGIIEESRHKRNS